MLTNQPVWADGDDQIAGGEEIVGQEATLDDVPLEGARQAALHRVHRGGVAGVAGLVLVEAAAQVLQVEAGLGARVEALYSLFQRGFLGNQHDAVNGHGKASRALVAQQPAEQLGRDRQCADFLGVLAHELEGQAEQHARIGGAPGLQPELVLFDAPLLLHGGGAPGAGGPGRP